MTGTTVRQGNSVLVTGGAGFLGAHVVERLQIRRYQHISGPRSKAYDLRDNAAVMRLFEDSPRYSTANLADASRFGVR